MKLKKYDVRKIQKFTFISTPYNLMLANMWLMNGKGMDWRHDLFV